MLKTADNIRACLLIGKLNEANFDKGEPMTEEELLFLYEWVDRSEDNKDAFERLARREWSGEDIPNDIYIYYIDSILFYAFKKIYGPGIYHHLRYFYLTARHVVVGLTDAEWNELSAWLSQSERNQLVFDQFTCKKYSKKCIRVMKKCTQKFVYEWFMEKYHPYKLRPVGMFFKNIKGMFKKITKATVIK